MLLIVLSTFVALSVTYNLMIPVYEGDLDEREHVEKINYIYTRHEIGNLNVAWVPIPVQPPLYHAVSAFLLYATGTGPITLRANTTGGASHFGFEDIFASIQVQAFHMLRGFSTVLGLLTIVATYKAAKLLYKKETELALLVASMNAFVPQFVLVSSVVSFDAMVALFSTTSIYYAFSVIDSKRLSRKDGVACGAANAAAMLTKLNTILFPFLTFGAFLWKKLSSREVNTHGLTADYLLVLATTLLFSGWFFLRNQILYGNPIAWTHDPIYSHPYCISGTCSSFVDPKSILSPYFLHGTFFVYLFYSFWVRFDLIGLSTTGAVYYVLVILVFLMLIVFSALSLVGTCLAAIEKHRKNPEMFRLLGFSVIVVLTVFAVVFYYNLWYTNPLGRNLFPAICTITIIMTHGLSQLSYRLAGRSSLLPSSFVVFLLLINVAIIALNLLA